MPTRGPYTPTNRHGRIDRGCPQRERGKIVAVAADEDRIAHALEESASDDYDLQMDAIRRLGELGGAPAEHRLIHLLQHDEDLEVREAAADALGGIQTNEAREALCTAVLNDREVFLVRGVAAEALARHDHPDSIAVLMEALPDDLITHKAARTLGSLRAKAALDPLRAAAQSTELPPGDRGIATEALGKVAGDRVVELMKPLLSDPAWEVRQASALATGTLGTTGCQRSARASAR
jgi:HEAT repeat protein